MAGESPAAWYRVNTRLLPVKGMYFLFVAGIGDLLPFIPIYMKQLGLSATETGIIYGIMPFISFFVRPVFGAIADKTKQHKAVIMILMVLTGVSYCLLLLTPDKSTETSITGGVRTHIQCGQADSFLRDCEDVMHHGNYSEPEPHLQMCDISLQHFMKQFNLTGKSVDCHATCKISTPFVDQTEVCFTNDVGPAIGDVCYDSWNHIKDKELSMTIHDISRVLDNEILGENMTQGGQLCRSYDLKNLTYNEHPYWQFLCMSDVTFDCVLSCGEDYHKTCLSVKSLSKTFWIFFVIFLFANIFFSPVLSLIDAIAYDILGEKRGHWGRQRNWGTIGFILFAVTSTFLMDRLSNSEQHVNFTLSFYIFVGLCVAAAIVSYFVQISETIQCHQMFKNLRELIRYPQVVLFLIVVILFGILNSVIETFLFWFLKDLGSSQITLGLCLVFNCIPEIIILYFAGRIMKKIGEVACFYIAALAYAIRFFAYSFLTNPWYVLSIEPLHCFTFGLFYAAASAYGSKITPPGMSGTVQGLIGGLYFGLSKGIGSLVSGKLMEPVSGLGSRWTFRFYGFYSIILLFGYMLIQVLFFRKGATESPSKTPVVKEAQDPDASAADDLLLGNNTVSNENTVL